VADLATAGSPPLDLPELLVPGVGDVSEDPRSGPAGTRTPPRHFSPFITSSLTLTPLRTPRDTVVGRPLSAGAEPSTCMRSTARRAHENLPNLSACSRRSGV